MEKWSVIADCLIALNHPGSSGPDTLALGDWIFSLAPEDREKLRSAETRSALIVEDVATSAMRAAFSDIPTSDTVAAWRDLRLRATAESSQLPWRTLPAQFLVDGPPRSVAAPDFATALQLA